MPVTSPSRRVLLGAAAAGAATAAAAGRARGQDAPDFPNRQIRIVAAFAPGGSVDLLARVLARVMPDRLGQPVVVENRSGAAGNVAAEHVARSAPDGYTLLFTAEPLTVNPAIYGSVPYDPIASFAPVNLTAKLTQALVVNNAQPVRSFGEFVALARSRPGSLNIGSGGNGAPGHLVCAMLNRAGVPVAHVPYRGGGPAAQAAIAGEVQGAVITLPGVFGLVSQGALRCVAVTSPARAPQAPEAMAMAEVIPGLVVESWHALFAPAATPAAVVRRLHEACAEGLAEGALRGQLLGRGFDPVAGPPEALADLLREEVPRWRGLVRDLNLRMD